jgi:glucose-6-phosphate dehydrogenase assembly protein OpcA
VLVIHAAIAEGEVQRKLGEKPHQVLWPETAPRMGDFVSMGAVASWVIVEVQTYQTPSNQLAYLCLVHSQNDVCLPRD